MRVRILALKLLKCIETRSYFVFQSSLKEKKTQISAADIRRLKRIKNA